jgi:hypothetical protein
MGIVVVAAFARQRCGVASGGDNGYAAADEIGCKRRQSIWFRQGVSTSHSGAAHVAFEPMNTLGPCDV